MTNEQLATLIHTGGNDELIPLLWEKVRALMYMKAGQYYRTHSETCAARGVQLWDIKQVSYLAYIAALKAFNPESGLKFLSYISFPFRNEVNELLRIRSRKTDALNKSISLDAPIKNDEGEDTTLGDLQPDVQSTDFVERLEAAMISEFIRNEVNTLEERQRAVITWYYFERKELAEIGELLNISRERVSQIKRQAEKELRRVPELRELYNEYYRSHHSHSKYFEWQPENYAAIRQERKSVQELTHTKSVAEILREYRARRSELTANISEKNFG